LIAFINILFRLDGELLFFQQRKKSNQKNAAPISLPFGFPHHSPLPTGRPDSPSRLDMTKSGVLPAKKDFLVPTKAKWLGKLHGGEILLS